MLNVLNGGAHADNNVDVQEFMIVPLGLKSFADGLRAAAEIFQTLKKVLHDRSYSTAVGDEGGFAPRVKSIDEAIELLLEAVTQAGYKARSQVALALDVASSEFYQDGRYVFKKSDGRARGRDEMVRLYEDWVRQYPIVSIEDPFSEDDWDGWRLITQSVCHEQAPPAARDRRGHCQFHPGQGQSDRLAYRDARNDGSRETFRLHDRHVAPLRRDRGCHDRGPRGRHQRGPDQDGSALSRRADR
jgi:hypothetical protein